MVVEKDGSFPSHLHGAVLSVYSNHVKLAVNGSAQDYLLNTRNMAMQDFYETLDQQGLKSKSGNEVKRYLTDSLYNKEFIGALVRAYVCHCARTKRNSK